MSHTILTCPGCRSKLRFRADLKRTYVDCPRCAERIDLDSAVADEALSDMPKPKKPVAGAVPKNTGIQSPQSKTAATPAMPTVRPTARRIAADDVDDPEEFADEFDEDVERAKRETWIVLGATGLAILAAVIAFPSVLRFFRNNDSSQGAVVESSYSAVPSEQKAASASPSTDDGNAASAQGTAPNPQKPKAENSVPPATQPPAVAVDTPSIRPESESGSGASASPKMPEPPTPVAPPVAVQPAPGAAGADTVQQGDPQNKGLQYGWRAGQEHVYSLKIEADHGGAKQNVSGTCTYRVKSNGAEATKQQEGSGTGFVVTSDGYIATCAHVVEGAKRIEVILGEKTYPAKVVAQNKKKDLAIIRIEAQNLSVSAFADSDKVQLAETVRAFGFPMSTVLGTGIKVVTGTVAGIVMDTRHGRQIQTDAPINPGNSGGPIVNDLGQVIGVASSKIASREVSSVGFAVPVNELKTLMKEQNLPVPDVVELPRLDGPQLAAQVTPTVAFVKVSGISGGKVFDIDFTASFMESQRFDPRNFRFGAFPMLPTANYDTGTMKVTRSGEIVEFTGKESLPFILGPVGQFFIEPLDPDGEPSWSSERETALRIVKREASNDPLSRMRSRMPFGPGGRAGFPFNPFGSEKPEETIKVIPATERTSYRLGDELNNRVTVHKEYEFTTTDGSDRPYLTVSGSGEITFDKTLGMPSRFQYSATIIQNEADGATSKLPLNVTFTLRDPEDLKRERAEAAKRAEESKRKRDEERTTPNPDLVDSLLKQIRDANGTLSAMTPLKKLATIATVPEKRQNVLEVVENHLKNSNGFVQGAAAEALCAWATRDQEPQLWLVLESEDHLLNAAKKPTMKKLIEFGVADVYHRLVPLMKNLSMRHDIQALLLEAGEKAEQPILDSIPSVADSSVSRELIEVLEKAGTAKSIPTLEGYAASSDIGLKFAAQRALDAIRARK